VTAWYVTQDRVEREALTLVESAQRSLDIASPWIEREPVQRPLAPALTRIRSGELSVRLVYRMREESDLSITDLAALEALAREGVQIRYSRRLHAKLLIADRERALIGSSNLTGAGGYGYATNPAWRNEEGGVLLEGEAVAEAAAHFDRIWEEAGEVTADLLGVVTDFPSVREFRFACVREVACGQLVAASDRPGREVVGEVVEVTAYNQSFPQMTEEMFLTQGLGGAPPRRVAVPDLPSLFSHPVKDYGFLVAKTYFRPESAFHVARVRVLREVHGGTVRATPAPIAPGSDVRAPSAAVLRALLGEGDVRLGRVQHHPEVGVWIRSDALLQTHLAVLGMTGSGKSNAVKHLLRSLLAARKLRVFVVDTHGEYLDPQLNPRRIDVSIPDKVNLLDFEMVREHFEIEQMTPTVKKALRAAGRQTNDPAQAARILAESRNDTVAHIAAAVEAEPERYCLGEEEPRLVWAGSEAEADLAAAGLYVLDLRRTETFEVRARKCAVLARRVFEQAKTGEGGLPALLVVDEAHNYIPERTTGYMAQAKRHGSLGALTTVAVEGRKFGVGLVIVSQRPSRVAKDVLAQMGSQLIFRLANVEDLRYVRESFEAAGEAFLAELPQLDTGVCICTGQMVAMPVRCDVPLFAPRHRFKLGSDRPPLADLKRAVAKALPGVALVAEVEEEVVFSDPRAEVTLRAADSGYVLDVDCADAALVEHVRAAIAVVSPTSPEQ
jgi:hypothetical protein